MKLTVRPASTPAASADGGGPVPVSKQTAAVLKGGSDVVFSNEAFVLPVADEADSVLQVRERRVGHAAILLPLPQRGQQRPP